MGETTTISRAPKLHELMREQEEIDSRTLSEFLQQGVLESGEERSMDGLRRGRRWRSFKESLKIRGMGCCGSSWRLDSGNMNEEMMEDGNDQIPAAGVENGEAMTGVEDCVGQIPAVLAEGGSGVVGMNLAAALVAERHFRAAQEWEAGNSSSPLKVSLWRLLEEGDGGLENGGVENGEKLCCVCMAKQKGAAFIPCGHTFCRACSRELWVNRGSCPLCNRSIIEVLDIF